MLVVAQCAKLAAANGQAVATTGAPAGYAEAFLGRMLFSCLVDADFLATEAFYARASGVPTDRGDPTPLAELRERLDRHLAELVAVAQSSPLNSLRADILAHARGKAADAPGLFTMTVPTGGGKTLASLAFALDHAIAHGLDRVIYVIPYTGAWIETRYQRAAGRLQAVAPRAGAWIETAGTSSRHGLRRVIANDRQVALAVRNTIELGDDGSMRVIAAKPLRSRDLANDADDARQEYLMPRSERGLTFADFGGYPKVVARARALIDTQLDRRDALRQMGARPIKGILFTGPPGTGKTHLARIIADQSEADFFLVSGPSVVSKWLGDSEDTLRRIFDAAAASAPNQAIIFFDEIDSIAERRTGESHEASKRLVAQLLTLMDGFDDKAGNIIVIASTNRVETLDPALTRPGRFDWEIEFCMPDLDDRFQILTVGASDLQTEGPLPLHDLAAMTSGWSAAELSVLWVEAALIATGEDRTKICGEDVARAFERVAQRPRHAFRKLI